MTMHTFEEWGSDVGEGSWQQQQSQSTHGSASASRRPSRQQLGQEPYSQAAGFGSRTMETPVREYNSNTDYLALGGAIDAGNGNYSYPTILQEFDGHPNDTSLQFSNLDQRPPPPSQIPLPQYQALSAPPRASRSSHTNMRDFVQQQAEDLESLSPALSLDMSYLTPAQEQAASRDELLPDGLGLFRDSSSVSASTLSPSPGLPELFQERSPEDGDFATLDAQESLLGIGPSNRQLPALMTDFSLVQTASVSNEVSPYQNSPSFSWTAFESADEMAVDDVSNDAWSYASIASSPNLGWSNGPGSYSLNGTSELSASPNTHTDTSSVHRPSEWSVFSATDARPGEGVDIFGFSPSNRYSPTGSAATGDTVTSQTDSQLLTVPNPQFPRRMSDPPPVRKSLHRAAAPNQRARANSSAYPPLQPQPPQSLQKTSHAKGSGAPVVRQTCRGKRQGPMPDAGKKQARKTRMDKSLCISCKFSKTLCKRDGSPDSACNKCLKVTPNSKHPNVCTRAYFLDLVRADTTNYIAQFSINHLVPNSTIRRRLDVPHDIKIPDLIQLLESLGTKYRISVSNDATPLYDLDLGGCSNYLNALRPTVPSTYSFQSFIATQLTRSDDEWKTCIYNSFEKLSDPLEALISWNTMPSRVTYALVLRSTEAKRPLDPDHGPDRQLIFAAAQLSRIVSRKVELLTYQKLQNALLKAAFPAETLAQLARLLLSLRWRLSWWTVLGTGIYNLDCNKLIRRQEEFESVTTRVRSLCRILYFYYFFMRRRLSSPPNDENLQGRRFRYADTLTAVYETYPAEETVEGFEQWMMEGQGKIREARVAECLKMVGLAN